jgi:hypothetical protein
MWCFGKKKGLEMHGSIKQFIKEYKQQLTPEQLKKARHLNQKEKESLESLFYAMKSLFQPLPTYYFPQGRLYVNNQKLINSLLLHHIQYSSIVNLNNVLSECKKKKLFGEKFYRDFRVAIASLMYVTPDKLTPQLYENLHKAVAILVHEKKYIRFFKFIINIRKMTSQHHIIRRKNFESLLLNLHNVVDSLVPLLEINRLFLSSSRLESNIYLFETLYCFPPSVLERVVETLACLKKADSLEKWLPIVLQEFVLKDYASLHHMIINLSHVVLEKINLHHIFQRSITLITYMRDQLQGSPELLDQFIEDINQHIQAKQKLTKADFERIIKNTQIKINHALKNQIKKMKEDTVPPAQEMPSIRCR